MLETTMPGLHELLLWAVLVTMPTMATPDIDRFTLTPGDCVCTVRQLPFRTYLGDGNCYNIARNMCYIYKHFQGTDFGVGRYGGIDVISINHTDLYVRDSTLPCKANGHDARNPGYTPCADGWTPIWEYVSAKVLNIGVTVLVIYANVPLVARLFIMGRQAGQTDGLQRSPRKCMMVGLLCGDLICAIVFLGIIGTATEFRQMTNPCATRAHGVYLYDLCPLVNSCALIAMCVELACRKRYILLGAMSRGTSCLWVAAPWMFGLVVIGPLEYVGANPNSCYPNTTRVPAFVLALCSSILAFVVALIGNATQVNESSQESNNDLKTVQGNGMVINQEAPQQHKLSDLSTVDNKTKVEERTLVIVSCTNLLMSLPLEMFNVYLSVQYPDGWYNETEMTVESEISYTLSWIALLRYVVNPLVWFWSFKSFFLERTGLFIPRQTHMKVVEPVFTDLWVKA